MIIQVLYVLRTTKNKQKNLNPSFVTIDNPNFKKFKNDPSYHLSFFIDWDNIDEDRYGWVKNKNELVVKLLGITGNQEEVGVILARFHAG